MAQTSAKKTTFDAQTKLQIRASVRQKASLSARRLCSSIDGQRLQMLISRERKNLMVLPTCVKNPSGGANNDNPTILDGTIF